MKVSICVPVYGVEKYIKRCTESLFRQTYENIEYIFIDDCTPDKSISLLLDVLERYPERKQQVRIIRHEKNRGLAAARNTAIHAATGDFIMHVDSDDWIDENILEELVLKQKENDADIITADAIAYYPNQKKIFRVLRTINAKELTLNTIYGTNRIQIWGRLIRKTLYTDNGISVVEGLNMAEDYQVISRLAYYAKNVNWIENAFYHYINMNPSSYTNNFSRKNYEQAVRSYQIVYDFFSDKGPEYVNKCQESAMQAWFARLVKSLLYGDNCKDISAYVKNIIKSLDKKHMSIIPLYLKVTYYLPLNLAKLYLKFGRVLKKINCGSNRS